jgi:hypothetical protein
MKRVNIFVGNYGSGKTEISINAALYLRKQFTDVVLADIDIVNPYFRSSEHKDTLECAGIRVLMPEYANTNVDLPTLPPGVASVFSGSATAVLDCGGDPAGATALGSLKNHVEKAAGEMEVYFVINACRPLQSTLTETLEMVRVIEHVARIRVTALINNTNLGRETTANEIRLGQEMSLAVSEKLSIPLAYITGTKEVLEAYGQVDPGAKNKFFPIKIFTRPYWLDA